jgi:hypothetical protein
MGWFFVWLFSVSCSIEGERRWVVSGAALQVRILAVGASVMMAKEDCHAFPLFEASCDCVYFRAERSRSADGTPFRWTGLFGDPLYLKSISTAKETSQSYEVWKYSIFIDSRIVQKLESTSNCLRWDIYFTKVFWVCLFDTFICRMKSEKTALSPDTFSGPGNL